MKIKQSLVLGWSTLHLRAPFLALTPLLPLLQEHFGMDYTTTGLLSTLPLLIFALVSPFVGTMAEKTGMARLFGAAMAVLAVGALIRSYTGFYGLFLGTILIAAGIAVGNVLLPAMITSHYRGYEGAATGVFISLMNGTNALWTALIVPVAALIGWQPAAGFWVVTGLVAAAAWQTCPPDYIRTRKPVSAKNIFSRAAAWWVSFFMGTQSLVFFTLTAWLPFWVIAKGFTATDAGYYSFLFQLLGIPASFVVPMLATGRRRRWLTALICLGYLIGFCLLFAATTATELTFAIVLTGLIGGATFSLCMLAFSVRAASPAVSSRLTGIGQAIAYLFAGIGPAGVGRLYGLYGDFQALLPIFIIACLFLTLCGWKAMAFSRIGAD